MTPLVAFRTTLALRSTEGLRTFDVLVVRYCWRVLALARVLNALSIRLNQHVGRVLAVVPPQGERKTDAPD
jgi:hypothetical protein